NLKQSILEALILLPTIHSRSSDSSPQIHSRSSTVRHTNQKLRAPSRTVELAQFELIRVSSGYSS
ncbi:hypothetical protein LINPERHAP1_LOCUS40657, partial [Linum perenne]